MKLAVGIRKFGFRKWYERELLQGHAHLVLTLLCMLGVFAAAEAHDGGAAWSAQAFDLLTIGLCASVGVWALRRYRAWSLRLSRQALRPWAERLFAAVVGVAAWTRRRAASPGGSSR